MSTESRDNVIPLGGGSALMIICSIAACLGSFQFGLNLGFTSLTSESIQSDLGMNDDTLLLAGSLITVGCAMGAILSGFLDFLGRRGTAMLSCVPMAFGSLLVATTESPTVFCIARVLSGLGVGLSSYAVPLVIAESATPATRGLLLSFSQTAVVSGILLSMLVGGYYPGESPWRALAWISLVPAVIEFLLFLTMVPESPRWLLTHGKSGQALVALRRMRVSGHPFEEELLRVVSSIREAVAEAGGGIEEEDNDHQPLLTPNIHGSTNDSWDSDHPDSISTLSVNMSLYEVPSGFSPAQQWGMILGGHSWRNILAVVAAQFLQAFSGINAVVFWAGSILKSAGYSSNEIPLWSVCFCVAQLVSALAVVPIVDKVGRRPLFATSQLIAGASLALLAFIPLYPSNDGFWGILPAVGILIFEAGFSVGLGPIPWVLLGEIVPLEVRAAGVSMASTSNWIFNFIVVRFLAGGSVALNFSIFSALMLCGSAFTWRFLPETKGLPLRESVAMFSPKKQH